MKFVLFLDEIEESEDVVALVGVKAYNLGRLTRAGFPVPPGCCFTTNAYHHHLAANGLTGEIEALLARSDLSDNEKACLVQQTITTANLPLDLHEAVVGAYRLLSGGEPLLPVAVRSSALAEDTAEVSFAGQHETVLGVVGNDALLTAVRRCWASLWSERALAYRRRLSHIPIFSHSHTAHAAMAVVMQRMVPAAQAGVAFTLDPVSGRRDVIVVEAVTGRGEALVSGQATPHRYVVQRGSGHPKAGKGVLDGARLAAVVRLAQKVEGWAGRPQDVEWALDGAGRVHLLQARPITVSGSAVSEVVTHWTRDNVGEVLPDPVTPLSWSVLDPLGNRSFAGVLHRLGVGDYPATGLFGRFYGRVYLNQTLFQAMMSRFYPSHAGWRTAPRLVLTALKALWLLHCLPTESEEIIRVILEQRRFEEDLDLAALAPAGVLARLAAWRGLDDEAMEIHLAVSVLAELLYQALDKLLARWSNETTTAATLTTGLTGVRSAEAGQALAALAQWVCRDKQLCTLVLTTPPEALLARLAEAEMGRALWARIKAFLAEHGHSAAQEFELAAPRWRDDPTIILSALQAQVRAAAVTPESPLPSPPMGGKEGGTAARLAAVARIESRLGPSKRWLFRRLLCRAQIFTIARENLKYHFVIAHSRLRDLYLALADQLVAAGKLANQDDVFFLTADEVEALIDGRLTSDERAERVIERRQAWEADQQTTPPFALNQHANGRLSAAAPPVTSSSDDSPLLRGFAASPGTYTGRARVVLTPADGAGLKPSEVLVAPATSPGWAPLLLAAGALVTEIGGTLSHGAIIAREYGLPAVLNVADATHRVRTGQLVHVDGSRGTVQLLEEVEREQGANES